MRRRILEYRRRIDALLAGTEAFDVNAVLQEHLVQIGFFQHERLIHLLVTMLVALLLMLSFALAILAEMPRVFLLSVLFLVLLVPYLRHYYLLENETQKLYAQYDELLKRKKAF